MFAVVAAAALGACEDCPQGFVTDGSTNCTEYTSLNYNNGDGSTYDANGNSAGYRWTETAFGFHSNTIIGSKVAFTFENLTTDMNYAIFVNTKNQQTANYNLSVNGQLTGATMEAVELLNSEYCLANQAFEETGANCTNTFQDTGVEVVAGDDGQVRVEVIVSEANPMIFIREIVLREQRTCQSACSDGYWYNQDQDCQQCLSCEDPFEQTANCTAVADTVCECPAGKWRNGTQCLVCTSCDEPLEAAANCTAEADTVCKCPAEQWRNGTQCTQCSQCDNGFEQIAACSEDADTECGCQEDQWLNGTQCTQCSECGPGFNTTASCDVSSDTVCECPEGKWINERGVCVRCTQCQERTETACTQFSDTVCGCNEGQYIVRGECFDCSSCGALPTSTNCTTDEDTKCDESSVGILNKWYYPDKIVWEGKDIDSIERCAAATYDFPFCRSRTLFGARTGFFSQCFKQKEVDTSECNNLVNVPEWHCKNGIVTYEYDYRRQSETVTYECGTDDDVCARSRQGSQCCEISPSLNGTVVCSNLTRADCTATFCAPAVECRFCDPNLGLRDTSGGDSPCGTFFYRTAKSYGVEFSENGDTGFFSTSDLASAQFDGFDLEYNTKYRIWLNTDVGDANYTLQSRALVGDQVEIRDVVTYLEAPETVQGLPFCNATERFDRATEPCVDGFQIIDSFTAVSETYSIFYVGNEKDGDIVSFRELVVEKIIDQCESCRDNKYFDGNACTDCTKCEGGTYTAVRCTDFEDTVCKTLDPLFAAIYIKDQGQPLSVVITTDGNVNQCYAATPETPCCTEVGADFSIVVDAVTSDLFSGLTGNTSTDPENIYEALLIDVCTEEPPEGCDGATSTLCTTLAADQFCPGDGQIAYVNEVNGYNRRVYNCDGETELCAGAVSDFPCCSETDGCISDITCPDGFTECQIGLGAGEIAGIVVGSLAAAAGLAYAYIKRPRSNNRYTKLNKVTDF